MTNPTDTQEETETEVESILFFAYGTLRRGERLHDWIADEVMEDIGETAVMPFAKLHYAVDHKAYPYLVQTSSPSEQTIGEVYRLPLNRQVISMLQMEMNAGYEVVEAEAIVDGERFPVVVCAWSGPVGTAITDNDWTKVSRGWW